MTRYRGPKLRIIRRLGELPGFTQKITSRQTLPGQHAKRQIKLSQYGVRLQEKQKLRYYYGLTETQLINYVRKARLMKGPTGELLLSLLEMRLDNILFRLNLAPTIVTARQFISHGHICVNQKKVDIASYQCEPKDVISVVNKKPIRQQITNFLNDESSKKRAIPSQLSLNKEYLTGIINDKIESNSVGLNVNELLIVEFYSRKI